jgi:hypothetical protein
MENTCVYIYYVNVNICIEFWTRPFVDTYEIIIHVEKWTSTVTLYLKNFYINLNFYKA